MRYNDRAPWAADPDGVGPSIERVLASRYGNDAANWAASVAEGGTPGRVNSKTPSLEPGGLQLPGDSNQNGRIDISGAVALLGHLVGGWSLRLPCDGATAAEGGNRALFDVTGDSAFDLSDPIHVLVYLFRNGPPPVRGTTCARIA